MALGYGSGKSWKNAGDGPEIGKFVRDGYITSGNLNLTSGDEKVSKYFDKDQRIVYYKYTSLPSAPSQYIYAQYDWTLATSDTEVRNAPDRVGDGSNFTTSDPIVLTTGINGLNGALIAAAGYGWYGVTVPSAVTPLDVWVVLRDPTYLPTERPVVYIGTNTSDYLAYAPSNTNFPTYAYASAASAVTGIEVNGDLVPNYSYPTFSQAIGTAYELDNSHPPADLVIRTIGYPFTSITGLMNYATTFSHSGIIVHEVIMSESSSIAATTIRTYLASKYALTL